MEEDKRPGAFGVLVHYQQPADDNEQKSTLSWLAPWWLAAIAVLATVVLAGCGTPQKKDERALLPEIREAMTPPPARPAPVPPSVQQALVPPPDLSLPQLSARPVEPRFDLNVVNLPVAQVFAALAKDTRYSMLVDPQLTGNVTVNLKDVTLIEALDTLRDMYGFEYRAQGTRIFVQPASLQTRVFQVNYLTANRAGKTDVRVTSGSIALSASGGSGSGGTSSSGSPSPTGTPAAPESSRLTTQSQNDLWTELQTALRLLIGAGDKPTDPRQVIVSPQSSVIVVRALPRELRVVEEYLRAARLNVERQVMLEAKIVEVRLRDSTQTGVNWQAFRSHGGQNGSLGPLNPGTTLSTTGTLSSGPLGVTPGIDASLGPTATNGLFGLAFQTGNFAALLSFLETQGEVQVLSSPRIAALNNQKAVLKVGTDDFFVTGITTNTTTSASGSVVSPTITVQPFFSGVALDVTPQIDADANIILHVHPSVSNVTERVKQLNLGSLGNFTLPLASSTVSESDTIVRARDGHIVAIGGLMKVSKSSDRSQLPGAGDIPVAGHLFGSRSRENDKQELVILIKPTVIHSDAQADATRDEALARIDALTGGSGSRTR